MLHHALEVRRLVGVSHQDRVRSAQTAHRLPKPSARQQPLSAERVRRVDEDQVGIPMDSPVLESVVEEDRLRTELGDGQPSRRHPIAADNHRNPRQALRQKNRLVPGLPPSEPDRPPV